jgi:pimeloyl-ACP methyl ester carboxylesterase
MSEKQQSPSPLGALLGLVGTTIGGWIAYSTFFIDHRKPIGPAIPAQRQLFNGSTTRLLNYYVDKSAQGRPLVLIHSINAAATAYEMRPIFEYFRTLRPVYALDLPGFGFSTRADVVYTPQLYVDAILDLLDTQVGETADVIALSLGCEFAAKAALKRPDLFNTLTLISPSGLAQREGSTKSQRAGDRGTSNVFYEILAFPLWGRAIFDALTTPQSIRWFLEQSFAGPVDEGLVHYDHLTARQPGAHHAPLYFVSGQLFTPNIREKAYEKLTLPVLVLYDEDNFVGFDALPGVLARNGNWRAERITPTKGLPQFEKMPAVASALQSFWSTVG